MELYANYYDTDNEESSEEYIGDKSSGTEDLFFKTELYKKLWEAFDKLEYEERSMLYQYLGICPNCRGTNFADYNDVDIDGAPKTKLIKPMMFTDIATDHGYSQPSSAKRICEGALEKLREAVKDYFIISESEITKNTDDMSIYYHCSETDTVYNCSECSYMNPDSHFCGFCFNELLRR